MSITGSIGGRLDVFEFSRISISHARRLKRLNDAKNR
jgi:hypothetical protein